MIKNGAVVKTWGSQSQRGNWASSSKPVLSTLLFFAIDQGKLAGVDARVGDQGWKLADKDRAMTFAHLANMTSGYARPEPPGEAWAYNDYAIQLYQKTLFDHVFQGDPDQVAATCFAPLQLEDGLQFDPKRRRLLTSVRDFARVAWFWLNKGNWNGRQVLPRKFFDDYQRPHVPAGLPVSREAETNDYLNIGTYGGGSSHFNDGGPGLYGFNWWFNAPVASAGGRLTWPDAPADTFMSVGAGGYCAVMIPSEKLVLVAAAANWGELEPGHASAIMNQRIRLLLDATRRDAPAPCQRPALSHRWGKEDVASAGDPLHRAEVRRECRAQPISRLPPDGDVRPGGQEHPRARLLRRGRRGRRVERGGG